MAVMMCAVCYGIQQSRRKRVTPPSSPSPFLPPTQHQTTAPYPFTASAFTHHLLRVLRTAENLDFSACEFVDLELLESLIECDFALHCDLISRDAAFEEVGEFLDVLQFHEREWVAGFVLHRKAEHG